MVRIIECEQGTDAWYAARRGIATASEFDKIITPTTCEYSKQSRPYMLRLIAEKLLGETIHEIGNLHAVERGKLLEPQAALAYEIEKGVETLSIGFALSDDGQYGASPDRLLKGIPGGIELKCPQADTHLSYWFDGFGTKYHCQRQGQMLVCDLEFIDMYSYHPRLPSKIARIHRDDDFIAKLQKALDQFSYEKSQLEAKLRATGFFEEIEEADDGWAGYLTRLDQRGMLIDAG
jgi:hypothetical protein